MVQSALLEFADKINGIFHVLAREFSKRQFRELYKVKVTLPQFFILQFLAKEGESTMTGLAHFMRVSTPAMTGIVDRLVKSKYVIRVFDPQDRRIIRVRLTGKGKNVVNKTNEDRRIMIIKLFGKISETDRQNYLKILTKIRDILMQGGA